VLVIIIIISLIHFSISFILEKHKLFSVGKVEGSFRNQFLDVVTSSEPGKIKNIMLCDEKWLNKYFRDSLEGLGEEKLYYMFYKTMLII